MGSLSLVLQANKYCLMPGYCFDLIVSEGKKKKKKGLVFCKLETKLGRSSLMSSLQENHVFFSPSVDYKVHFAVLSSICCKGISTWP